METMVQTNKSYKQPTETMVQPSLVLISDKEKSRGKKNRVGRSKRSENE